ncbi:MAG: type II toxin-antitoxin system Phd/YefM family antitoxin [Alphaproteobacteria bacterium]
MRTESATDAKNNFGALMDAALREPIVIQRSGRNSVVMLAYEDYEHLLKIIDSSWGQKADAARKKGSIGTAKSKQLLNDLLNARD